MATPEADGRVRRAVDTHLEATMTLFRLHRLPLIMALALPLLAPAAAAPDDRDQRHAAALAEYEACHWATAYQTFAVLAEEGHRPAARIALLMAARGPALYGQSFAASAAQRQRWAAQQVPPVAADFFAAEERLATR
jgi:hypothetical protein